MEMEPTTEERLDRIREVTEHGLRYYATAYLKTPGDEAHTISERDLLMAHMTQLANVLALLDGDDLGDRSMLAARHEVVSRYLDEVRHDPWTPPDGPSGS